MTTDEFRNVLLLVIDTLRGRNVGLYGSSHDTTPSIDKFGSDGVVFDRAVCTQSGSWISYTTMFRGDHVFGFPLTERDTFDHAMIESSYKMAYDATPTEQTVIGRLSDTDVHASAIVSGSMLDKKWGWARGFDSYDDNYETKLQTSALTTKPTTGLYRIARKLNQNRFPPFGTRPAGRTATLANQELERLDRLEDPWFFFLQFTDPHTPNTRYDGAPGNWHYYDQDIRRSDDAVGEILEKLDTLGLNDSTLVILTADHGESLGEHGATRGHGQNVFEESIRVPLLLRHPSLKPQRIRQEQGIARIKDIAPTILDAFEIDASESFSGQSLLPVISGDEPPPSEALIFARAHITINQLTDEAMTKEEAGPVVALHTGSEKFLITPALESEFEWQFNLRTDPRERRNLIGTSRESNELRNLTWQKIQEWEDRAPTVPSGSKWTSDYEMNQQLKDLGYLD